MVALLIAATAPGAQPAGRHLRGGERRDPPRRAQHRQDPAHGRARRRPGQHRRRTAAPPPPADGAGHPRPHRHRLRRADRRGSRPRLDRLHRRPCAPLPRRARRAPPRRADVVALGPLTNLASAALNGVDLAGGLRELVWMGGALEERGNTTETGEWNACVDPEAAEACLAAGAISRIFPLDATQDVIFTLEDLDGLPGHAAGGDRPRRGPLLRRVPSAGGRDRRLLPARPGDADRLAAPPGPRHRYGRRATGLRHRQRSAPGRQPVPIQRTRPGGR